MKKIPILLVFMCFAAHADWQLAHTDTDQARFFIDKDNLNLINGFRREQQPVSVTNGCAIAARVAAAKAGLLWSF